MPAFVAKLTPSAAIERLKNNDASLTSCDLSNNAVLQMKGKELWPQLGDALATNKTCTELNLSGCAMNDFAAEHLAAALQKNSKLASINLENNSIGNDGAIAIARALALNRGLILLNLMGQKGARYGDTTLAEYLKMFETNVTLLKIIWRLESRQSFRLTKMLTRNNDIDRRIKSNREYADLLPEGVSPFSNDLIAQRAESASIVGPTRTGSVESNPSVRSAASDRASAEIAAARASSGSERADSMRSRGDSLPEPAAMPPPVEMPAAPPPLSMPTIETASDLESAIAALTLEKEKAMAKLEAEFAEKKAHLLKQLGGSVDLE